MSGKEFIILLITNGVFVTLIGLLIQYLINKQNIRFEERLHRQNLDFEERLHRQSIEFEERKRTDYFIKWQHDHLAEFGIKLNQLIICWWLAAFKAEKKKGIVKNIWNYKFPVKTKDFDESISYSELTKQYELFEPKDIPPLMREASQLYQSGDFLAAQKTIVNTAIKLKKHLKIEESKEETEKIFKSLTKKR